MNDVSPTHAARTGDETSQPKTCAPRSLTGCVAETLDRLLAHSPGRRSSSWLLPAASCELPGAPLVVKSDPRCEEPRAQVYMADEGKGAVPRTRPKSANARARSLSASSAEERLGGALGGSGVRQHGQVCCFLSHWRTQSS